MVEQNPAAVIEWVDIVDEQNNVIAQSSRQQMRAQRLRHRATYIVVHDGMGKILVQRRTESKDFHPGKLDATAGALCKVARTTLNPLGARLKKNWGSPVCRSRNTANSILKKSAAEYGGRYSVVCLMAPLRYNQRKLMKYAGWCQKRSPPAVTNLHLIRSKHYHCG